MKRLIYKKSLPGSREEQFYIHMLFRNFKKLSKKKQDILKQILHGCSPAYHEALFEYLSTNCDMRHVLTKYYIASPTTIYRALYNVFKFAVSEELLWQ